MLPYRSPYPQHIKAPVYRRHHTEIDDFKTVVTYGMLGLGTVTGLVFLGRHMYKKAQVKNIEMHSAEEGNPATYARQFRMAFENDNSLGWGTNEELVFQTIREIPSKATYAKTQSAYHTLYQRSLNADLEDELSSDEYNEIIRILSTKKQK